MKRNVRIIALVLVAAMVCVCFVSCGKKLSGKYTMEAFGTGATLVFKGSKVTLSIKAVGVELSSIEGKYSIKDGKITMEFSSEEDEAKKYNGTFDFEETDDGIKIGTIGSFKKVD